MTHLRSLFVTCPAVLGPKHIDGDGPVTPASAAAGERQNANAYRRPDLPSVLARLLGAGASLAGAPSAEYERPVDSHQ
jgi:hypothetical protein